MPDYSIPSTSHDNLSTSDAGMLEQLLEENPDVYENYSDTLSDEDYDFLTLGSAPNTTWNPAKKALILGTNKWQILI